MAAWRIDVLDFYFCEGFYHRYLHCDQNFCLELGVVAHTCHLNYQEAEEGGS
jgi:hypothetical protein